MPQSVAQVHLHLVFSTKNRAPFLSDRAIRGAIHAYLATILNEHGCFARVVDGTADHVHALFQLSRTVAIAAIVGEFKRRSSKRIETKGQCFANFEWQSGYGVFSVSHSNVRRVVEYVLRKEEHHQRLDFQGEFRKLLQRHGVEIDERYVWD